MMRFFNLLVRCCAGFSSFFLGKPEAWSAEADHRTTIINLTSLLGGCLAILATIIPKPLLNTWQLGENKMVRKTNRVAGILFFMFLWDVFFLVWIFSNFQNTDFSWYKGSQTDALQFTFFWWCWCLSGTYRHSKFSPLSKHFIEELTETTTVSLPTKDGLGKGTKKLLKNFKGFSLRWRDILLNLPSKTEQKIADGKNVKGIKFWRRES